MTESSSKTEYLVGVDFGGTKILAGVFTNSLRCLGTAKSSTKAERGPEAVVERIARCVQDAVDECDLSLKQIKGIGLGAPGAVDPETGTVIFAPNLQWEDVPLKKIWKSTSASRSSSKTTATSAPSVCMRPNWIPSRATSSASSSAPASAAG